MNVAFFNTVKFWGGGEKLHFEHAVKFRQYGHKVWIVAAKNSPLAERSKKEGFGVFEIDLGNLSFLNPLTIKKINRFYVANDIEAVVFSNSPDLKAGAIAAKKANVGRIIYFRGLAVSIKNTFVNRRLLYDTVTHIVANSYATKAMIFKNLDAQKLETKTKVIYHGIEVEKFKPKEKIKDKGKIIVGNTGRLVVQKGQKFLLDIAERLLQKNVDFEIRIAGEGSLHNELEQKIKSRNLENFVKLTGFVEDVADFLRDVDIFAMTSLWEGFGFAIVEASAAGLPVVAFNLSSNPEVIHNGETGFLVDFPNVDAFADKIELLIKDKILRKKMGEAGRKFVQENFTIEKSVREFERFVLK